MPDAPVGLTVTEPLPPTLPLRERLVVGVGISSSGKMTAKVVAACQDGAVFALESSGWVEQPPIPQTPRWYQITGEAMEAASATSQADSRG